MISRTGGTDSVKVTSSAPSMAIYCLNGTRCMHGCVGLQGTWQGEDESGGQHSTRDVAYPLRVQGTCVNDASTRALSIYAFALVLGCCMGQAVRHVAVTCLGGSDQ